MMGDVGLSSYKQPVGDARGGSDSRIQVVSVASAEANGHNERESVLTTWCVLPPPYKKDTPCCLAG